MVQPEERRNCALETLAWNRCDNLLTELKMSDKCGPKPSACKRLTLANKMSRVVQIREALYSARFGSADPVSTIATCVMITNQQSRPVHEGFQVAQVAPAIDLQAPIMPLKIHKTTTQVAEHTRTHHVSDRASMRVC
jgi:hypothetical protein